MLISISSPVSAHSDWCFQDIVCPGVSPGVSRDVYRISCDDNAATARLLSAVAPLNRADAPLSPHLTFAVRSGA
jgi:hypothetical protein